MYYWVFLLCQSVFAQNEFVVGGRIHLDSNEDCYSIEYRANYKPLEISIDSYGQHPYSIMITEQKLDRCAVKCPGNATYCSSLESKKFRDTVYVCTDFVYVHIAKGKSERINVNLTTEFLKDVPCQGFERSTSNFCLMLSSEECMEQCSAGCGLLHCMLGRKEAFSMCLPYNTLEEEKETRCKSYEGVRETRWESCMDEESSVDTLWIILGVLVAAGLVIFVVSVFHYRYMLKNYGRPPYRIPGWCPDALYPRLPAYEGEALRVMQ